MGVELNLQRLHFVERKDKLMVIDRINGGWIMVPKVLKVLLPFLDVSPEVINEVEVERRVSDFKSLMTERGLGFAPPQRSKGLNTVILKLTKACNLACSYCYDFEAEDKARHMEKEIAINAIHQSIDLCEGKVNFILHGGEPMLVWSLIEELVLESERYSREKGVRVYFTGQTNLTRVDADKIKFSELHNIQWGISFDGPKYLHDAFRIKHNGKDGSYDTMVKMMRDYPSFIKRCNALSTITSVNQDKLVEIADHVRDLGFAGWDWTLFQAIGRGRNSAPFDCDIDVVIQAWDELFTRVEKGDYMGFPVKPILKYLNNFMDGPVDNMCMRSECGAGRDLLSVSFDGTIEACDCIDPHSELSKLGNMHSGGLAAARCSHKANYIRSRDVELLQCGSCKWQAVCGGTCLARAGGIDKVSEFECTLSMFAFDRISNSIASSDALIKYKQSCE